MFDFNDVAPLGHEEPSQAARKFLDLVNQDIDFAFQPIVDIHNGTVFGYEALMRGYEAVGAQNPFGVLDRADELNVLHRFDMMMRGKAISKYAQLPRSHKTKLFYNLDNRIISSPDYFRGATKTLLKQFGLPQSSLCLEISERHEVSMKLAEKNLARYRDEDYKTAIDDFGAGYSGLKLLQEYQPDFLKIDRSFITGIENDNKRKLMLSTITDLAHVLGIFVIAEGVETPGELSVCKEIGCDLVQGYLVARPAVAVDSFQIQYPSVLSIGRRRSHEDANPFIYEHIEYRPPLRVDDSMDIVFEAFRQNKDMTFFPVVDESGNPLGIIREQTLKEYTYSPFGKELIANRGTGLSLRKFLSSCPVSNVNADAAAILENFSLSESPEGIILVKEFTYLGFLSAASLLRVINENNLAQARDSNPLTKLPGNSSISNFVNEVIDHPKESAVLVYFDLDNFKAFNDAYGFRQGDRAIMLFAQLMRKHFERDNYFLGHVGGDDFFIGVAHKGVEEVRSIVEKLLQKFKQDVVSFYDTKEREQGCISAKDRHGEIRCFPLMSCSAALVYLPAGRAEGMPGATELDSAIAQTKKRAKESNDHLAICCF